MDIDRSGLHWSHMSVVARELPLSAADAWGVVEGGLAARHGILGAAIRGGDATIHGGGRAVLSNSEALCKIKG